MRLTVGEVIQTITGAIAAVPGEDTVDKLKTGEPGQEVTGIVTTFMATVEVIRKTIEAGANFIVTHEPTFYNHTDRTNWLEEDEIYQYKRKLLEENKIAVWRIHDAVHLCKPDLIVAGMVQMLGWEQYMTKDNNYIYTIPEVKLVDLVELFKKTFRLKMLRHVGRPEMYCRKIGLLVGAWGGDYQMDFLMREKIDVLVCGETAEWQTAEYIRDAAAVGVDRALLILGHANSEEPGMEYMNKWLGELFPGIAVTHIPAGDPLNF